MSRGDRPYGAVRATLSREFLLAEYVDKGRSAADIARTLGCVPSSVGNALRRFGIATRKPLFPTNAHVLDHEFFAEPGVLASLNIGVDCVLLPLYRDNEIVGTTLLDAADGDHVVARGRWGIACGYASRWDDGQHLALHRYLLGLPAGDPREGDHVNLVPLDNRRSNLRVLTHKGNGQNVPSQAGTSAFRGVSWDVNRRMWQAHATVDAKNYALGRYPDEVEAAEVARKFRLAHMSGAVA